MLLLAVIMVVACSVAAGMGLKDFKLSNEHRLPGDLWFKQRLDHFDMQNDDTWMQRYFINDTFWNHESGPVFIQIGGEGPANAVWVVEGAMMEYAKKFNALALLLEHRYYGKSQPRPNLSVRNLKWLSSEQALGDLASFIKALPSLYSVKPASKVITFGGSYPGALSSFARLKYPGLIYGAIASSAPVQAQVNFKEYVVVVKNALRYFGGSSCVEKIREATVDVNKHLRLPFGRSNLSSSFKTCSPIKDTAMEISNFASTLASNIMGIVQYNKDNTAFEGRSNNFTVSSLCDIMNNGEGSAFDRYVSLNTELLKQSGQKCLDVSYNNFLNISRNLSLDTTSGRQWIYQTCTEFGYFQSSDDPRQPFGSLFPIEFSIQQCIDIFGPEFDMNRVHQGVLWSLTEYGGRSPGSSHIVFVNGSIDPWHALSVLTDEFGIKSIFINGTAHCANMYPSGPDDILELKQARMKISATLAEWIRMDV